MKSKTERFVSGEDEVTIETPFRFSTTPVEFLLNHSISKPPIPPPLFLTSHTSLRDTCGGWYRLSNGLQLSAVTGCLVYSNMHPPVQGRGCTANSATASLWLREKQPSLVVALTRRTGHHCLPWHSEKARSVTASTQSLAAPQRPRISLCPLEAVCVVVVILALSDGMCYMDRS